MVSIIIVSGHTSVKNEIEKYASKLDYKLMLLHTKTEGNFLFYVAPIVPQHLLARTYLEYLEKRYSNERILKEAQLLIAPYKNKLPAVLLISFMGDWDSKGETSKTIPDDLADYLFLENDKGDYVHCLSAEIPFMENTVNIINDIASITLSFSLTYEKEGKKQSILENTDYIEFVIGGLGFEDNRTRYDLPLFTVTDEVLDIPESLKELFVNLGLTEYPPE